MHLTLDLLSQVLFVALMAMLLYVLYRRFVAMLSKGRITGSYARIVDVVQSAEGTLTLTLESENDVECAVSWEGGDPVRLRSEAGTQVHEIQTGAARPEQIRIEFANQVVRRRVG